MRSRVRALSLAAVTVLMTGCTAVAVKLVDEMDATISKLSQSDCELVRVVHGMDICRSNGSDAVLPVAYCYRTLGGVDCYDRAVPADRAILRQATSATAGLE